MRLLPLLALFAFLPTLYAETPPASPVKEVSPGIFEIGTVRLEHEKPGRDSLGLVAFGIGPTALQLSHVAFK